MATAPKFRIDVDIHNLLMNPSGPVKVPEKKGKTLPEPVFPRFPQLLPDPGPARLPAKRDWTWSQAYRTNAGVVVSVYSVADSAGRFSSHHGIFVCRVQMQS